MLLILCFHPQRSTKHTPYCAMFGREPRSPWILNSTKEEGPDTSIVADITEEVVVERTAEVQELHKKVMVK